MSDDVVDHILWLAAVIYQPTRRDAMRAVFDKITAIGRFRAADMPTLPNADYWPRGFAQWSRPHDHTCWRWPASWSA
jgi:hypothetical protein